MSTSAEQGWKRTSSLSLLVSVLVVRVSFALLALGVQSVLHALVLVEEGQGADAGSLPECFTLPHLFVSSSSLLLSSISLPLLFFINFIVSCKESLPSWCAAGAGARRPVETPGPRGSLYGHRWA